MIRWEYKILRILETQDTTARLNRAGREGWELVAALPDGPVAVRYFFKRPLPEVTP